MVVSSVRRRNAPTLFGSSCALNRCSAELLTTANFATVATTGYHHAPVFTVVVAPGATNWCAAPWTASPGWNSEVRIARGVPVPYHRTVAAYDPLTSSAPPCSQSTL